MIRLQRKGGKFLEEVERELKISREQGHEWGLFLFCSFPDLENSLKHREKVLNRDPGRSESPGSEKLLSDPLQDSSHVSSQDSRPQSGLFSQRETDDLSLRPRCLSLFSCCDEML